MTRMPPGVVTCPVLVALTSALMVSAADAQRSVGAEVHPEDAVTALTRALEAYPLVAIGEIHRNQQLHDLLVTVVRDARFLPNGGDIVVEFGNARYQDRMDRYIAGDTVDRKNLAQVWRDAVNILVWDAPVYERFFETVREVNRTRPTGKYLRVVLADRRWIGPQLATGRRGSELPPRAINTPPVSSCMRSSRAVVARSWSLGRGISSVSRPLIDTASRVGTGRQISRNCSTENIPGGRSTSRQIGGTLQRTRFLSVGDHRSSFV